MGVLAAGEGERQPKEDEDEREEWTVQAQVEALTIVTGDAAIAAYEVDVLLN